MKKIILLLAFIPLFGFSQNKKHKKFDCSKIEVLFDEMKDIKTSSYKTKSTFSLLMKDTNKAYTLHYSKSEKNETVIKTITFSGYGDFSMIGEKGLYIKLSNDEIIRFEDLQIESSYASSGTYTYICVLKLDNELVAKFSENEIIKFDLSRAKYNVLPKDSYELKESIKCITDN